MTAYVQIRPMTENPIKVVCKPCGLEQAETRWAYALATAKAHNHEHHGKGAE